MTATLLQKNVAKILAANRSEDSPFCGSFPVFYETGRTPGDIDICSTSTRCHFDVIEKDLALLKKHGYSVVSNTPNDLIFEAHVMQGRERVRIEWFNIIAYRYFLPLPHAELGFVVHPFDAAISSLSFSSISTSRQENILSLARGNFPLTALFLAKAARNDLNFRALCMNFELLSNAHPDFKEALHPLQNGMIPGSYAGTVSLDRHGKISIPTDGYAPFRTYRDQCIGGDQSPTRPRWNPFKRRGPRMANDPL